MSETTVIAARVSMDLAIGLDKIAAAEAGGFGRVTRADVMRRLLADGVAAHAATASVPARARSRAR